MTDRVRTITLLLKEDMRTDDAKTFAGMLQLLEPVAEVKFGEIVDSATWEARWEARHALGAQIHSLLKGEAPKKNDD